METTTNRQSSTNPISEVGGDKAVKAERITRGALYLAAGLLPLPSGLRAGGASAALTCLVALGPIAVGALLIYFTLKPRPLPAGVRVFPRSVSLVAAALLGMIGAAFLGLGVWLLGMSPTMSQAQVPIWIVLIPVGVFTLQLQARGNVIVDPARRIVRRSGFLLPRSFKFERVVSACVVRTETIHRVTLNVLWEEWQAGLEIGRGPTLLKIGTMTTPEGALARAAELSRLVGVPLGAERKDVK